MNEPRRIWQDQCAAAEGVQERFGTRKAIGYLVGEKLLVFLRFAEKEPAFASELPAFVAKVRDLFEPHELRGYLDEVRRVGAHGHVLSDEEFEVAREMFDEDVVTAAEDVIRMGRIREMLLE